MALANPKARPRRAVPFLRLERLEGRELLAAFTVTNASDAGAGSLRQAILDNNATPGSNSISFNIPGSGVRSIALASPLPDVSNPAVLDATTQPGYSGTPLVELNGANIFRPDVTPPNPLPNVDGLVLSGGSTTVKGLTIDRFTGSGIRTTRDGNTIQANFLGTDPTGTRSQGNGLDGIAVFSRNNTIGGANAASRNLISGNTGAGIELASISTLAANNVIQGNLIGTDVTGANDIGNAITGVFAGSSGNSIGGATTALGNVIAFNGASGVQVGTYYFDPVNRDRISHNSIFGNAGLGIDLGGDGVTFGGFTSGPNGGQPYPNLTSAYSSGGSTSIEGRISTAPNTPITVEFYANDQPDPSGFGQGRTFLGSRTFVTDISGGADVTTTLPISVPTGQFISATATDGSGNTSEFARSIVVAASAQADLSLLTFDPSPTAQATEARSYFYQVTNNGPSRATNLVVTDTLPVGARFQSGSVDQGTLVQAGGVVTITLPSLESGSTVFFSLNYAIPTAGTAVNVLTARADQDDPAPRNTSITQNIQVSPAPAIDLNLSGSGSPDAVQVGDDVTYTFVVTNFDFSSTATGVVLTDALPDGVTYVSSRSSQGTVGLSNGALTADLGSLNPFFNAVVTIVVRPTSPGLLANTATVKGSESDSNALNNQATVATSVSTAPATDLAVIVAGAPQPAQVGRGFTYAIQVGNAGSAPATNVILSNLLPDAATVLSIRTSQGSVTPVDGMLTVNLGTLAPGAVAQLTVVLQPGAPGVIVDQASVTSDQPDFNIVNNYSMLGTLVTADASGPTILNQRLVVTNNAITSIVLTFDKALDPSLAVVKRNYQILGLGQNGSTSADGPNVPIASVTYNPASRSVTLVPRKALSIGQFYKLIVNGEGAPGLVDTSGNVLDGVGNGLQNSTYTSLLARGTADRPTAVQLRNATQHVSTGKSSTSSGTKTKTTPHKVVVTVQASAQPKAKAKPAVASRKA